MENNMMILGEGQFYSLDCYKTQLNNNVLVVGTSGAGKTRSIVSPNLLQAAGSYIVSDPKGNLYDKFGPYLKKHGYVVMKLDFTDPRNSSRYNFFQYINSVQDIVKISHMLVCSQTSRRGYDPFWDEASQLLIESVIAYLRERTTKKCQNYHSMMKVINFCTGSGDLSESKTPLDYMMEELEEANPNSFALSTYRKIRVSADRTLRSILISVNARIGLYDTPDMNRLMEEDDIDIASIGKRKTALFVVTSDTDRSMDGLANIFFSQAMNELCRYADKSCQNNCLPVPVRFILDDFATNCKIEEFPRMIASIRSRGISAMLMIQAESQLEECYGTDGRTIISNCDSYVYLGGNDVDTAKAVAIRCDVPLKKILNMPVGSNWIFRRGQEPVNGRNFRLEPFLQEKMGREREDL